MAVEKIQKKVTRRPRKVATKKAKSKNGGLEAIEHFVKIVDKYNLDLTYLKK
jgi:hypothetical protein